MQSSSNFTFNHTRYSSQPHFRGLKTTTLYDAQDDYKPAQKWVLLKPTEGVLPEIVR